MAFSSRLGMLVRKSGQASLPSMFNSIRCMSSSNLFIRGLSWGMDDESLKEAFSGFGEVAVACRWHNTTISVALDGVHVLILSGGFRAHCTARAVTDRDTGRPRGFGFVFFTSEDSATSALSAMDGQELDGRTIRVSYVTDRHSGPRSFNNGY